LFGGSRFGFGVVWRFGVGIQEITVDQPRFNFFSLDLGRLCFARVPKTHKRKRERKIQKGNDHVQVSQVQH
jgi:hypothetical protein